MTDWTPAELCGLSGWVEFNPPLDFDGAFSVPLLEVVAGKGKLSEEDRLRLTRYLGRKRETAPLPKTAE